MPGLQESVKNGFRALNRAISTSIIKKEEDNEMQALLDKDQAMQTPGHPEIFNLGSSPDIAPSDYRFSGSMVDGLVEQHFTKMPIIG